MKKIKPEDKPVCHDSLFSCRGKVCVVTGALGLVGRQVVQALRDFGAIVYGADIEPAVKPGNLAGKNFIVLDIASEQSVRRALTAIWRKETKIDVLVNCAYPRTKDWGNRLEKVSLSSWNKNINDHLGGYFISSRIAAELMKKNKSGSIINFGSIYGVTAPDFSIYEGTAMTMPVAYAAIKAGVIAFTKYLAVYYGKDNVRANVISPGGIFNGQPKKFVDNYAKKTPLKRMAKPCDIAGAVVFLASQASGYVTGQNLIVDGGWTA